MAIRPIPLNGGLVTAKPPAFLGEGDLALAQCVEMKPGAISLSKMEGFEEFSVLPSGHGPSLHYMSFKSGFETVMKSGYLSGGSAGLVTSLEYVPLNTGLDISSGVPGNIYKQVDQLDCIFYNDEYFLLFGGNTDKNPTLEKRNFVATGGGNGRYHGMIPNSELTSDITVANTYVSRRARNKTRKEEEQKTGEKTPKVGPADGVNTGFTLTSGNTISYWIEERVKDSFGNILRRNVGTSATVRKLAGFTGTTFKPLITRPAVVNSDATHWALFGTATNVDYPNGFQLDEVAIAQTTIEDTRTGANPLAPTGSAYGVLSANVGGVVITVPKYGTAPLANIGDEFEGSLCTDDPDIPGLLRFSLPGDFDHFPVINGIQIGRRDNEKLTMIKRLGNALMVGTDYGLYRVSTLLRAGSDAGFNLDRVVEVIEPNFGVVSQKSATVFSSAGGPKLAYLTAGGLRITDGSESILVSANLDWPELVEPAQLVSAFIVDNPDKFRFELYYAQTGEIAVEHTVGGQLNVVPAIPTHSLHFYYDRSLVRHDGLPVVLGPHPITATSGCLVREGVRKRVYLSTIVASSFTTHIVKADGGDSFIFSSGTTPIAVDVRTGQFYFGGMGGSALLESVAVHHSEGAIGQTLTVARISRSEGQEDVTATAILDLDMPGISTMSTLAFGFAEAFQFQLTNSDSLGSFDIDLLLADTKPKESVGGFSKV